MGDLILLICLIAGTYLCSLGFSIVIFKMFFPLKAKEIEERGLTLTYSKARMPQSFARSKIQLLSGEKR